MIENSFNPAVEKINKIFEFRKQYDMENDCMLDVIQEYCFKNNIDDIELFVSDISEVEGFVEMLRNDMIKFKYMSNTDDCISNNVIDEWSN